MHTALHGPAAVLVVAPAQVPLAPEVEQQVAGAAVEAGDATVGVQQRQVGDAAEVEHGHLLPRQGEAGGVEGRHQRCALAAGGQVAAAEVADHVDAAGLGQRSAVVELHGVGLRDPGRRRAVPHGLAVRADRAHLGGGHAGCGQQRGDGVGGEPDQRAGGQRCAVQFVVATPGEREQRAAQVVGQGRMTVRADRAVQPAGTVVDLGEDGVEPVERGARHQADVQRHRFRPGRRVRARPASIRAAASAPRCWSSARCRACGPDAGRAVRSCGARPPAP